MKICCTICDNNIFGVILWGVLLMMLLLLGRFIKIRTWGNFNCGFRIWSGSINFDGIKLLVVFIIFEIEIIVVVIMISSLMLLLLMVVTMFELLILYI